MCISGPKIPANPVVPPPTNLVADSLNLGTNTVQARSANQIGRQALTAPRQVAKASAPTPSGTTTGPSVAGTLGLPTSSVFNGNLPVYGGLQTNS